MNAISGRRTLRWCKATLKYGLVAYCCFWLGSCYFESERLAEERDRDREVSKKCNQKLAGMKHVPILGGAFLDVTKLPGFHFGTSSRNGLCIADVLEGSFWWTGVELRPADGGLATKPLPSWRHFSVSARLFTRKASTAPIDVGRKTVDWPEELVVKLTNYPGLELWLTAHPPSTKNEFSVTSFVVPDWRRRDRTPRMIWCNGLGFSSSEVLASGLNRGVLLTLNKEQLKNINFGDLDAYCTVELHDFDFSGGDARVHFGTVSLESAPEALKILREYLSDSIITGK